MTEVTFGTFLSPVLPGVIEEEVWRACFAVGGEQNAGQVPSAE